MLNIEAFKNSMPSMLMGSPDSNEMKPISYKNSAISKKDLYRQLNEHLKDM